MTTDRAQGLSETTAVEPVHRAITKGGMVRTACNLTWTWVPQDRRQATYRDERVTYTECLRTLKAANIGL